MTKEEFDSLMPNHLEVLADIAFNVGNISSFPKLKKAAIANDTETMKKECLRKYTDK